MRLEKILTQGNTTRFKFEANPNVSNQQIFTFFRDIAFILRELDSNINSETVIDKNFKNDKIFNKKIIRASQRLYRQTKDNSSQSSHLIYFTTTPKEITRVVKEPLISSKFQGNDTYDFHICSPILSYNVQEMLNELKRIGYIQITEEFTTNNIKELYSLKCVSTNNINFLIASNS